MAGRGQLVNVLVLPVTRRHWLYAAKTVDTPVRQAEVEPGNSAPGINLVSSISGRVLRTAQRQWEDLKASPEGSWKQWLYKKAAGLLAREDPSEVFFKSLPTTQQPYQLNVIHPASVRAAAVRRRLALLARFRRNHHWRLFLGSAAAALPLLPLALSPLPNIPLYYMGYRVYSHRCAWRGAQAMQQILTEHSGAYQQKLDCQDTSATVSGARSVASESMQLLTFEEYPVPDGALQGRRSMNDDDVSQHLIAELSQRYGLDTLAQSVTRIRELGIRYP